MMYVCHDDDDDDVFLNYSIGYDHYDGDDDVDDYEERTLMMMMMTTIEMMMRVVVVEVDLVHPFLDQSMLLIYYYDR